MGFHGRYVYAGGRRNFALSEAVTAVNAARGLSTLRQTVVLGDASRKQGTGDFSVTFMPSEKWTITNTTAINNTRILGEASSYHSPLARVSLELNKNLSWNVGWQFYNYSEQFTGRQNYHAHVGYSSFRWTF